MSPIYLEPVDLEILYSGEYSKGVEGSIARGYSRIKQQMGGYALLTYLEYVRVLECLSL